MLEMLSTETPLSVRPADMSHATIRGVNTTPMTLEAEALHTAAGTLPRAIDVNAIED